MTVAISLAGFLIAGAARWAASPVRANGPSSERGRQDSVSLYVPSTQWTLDRREFPVVVECALAPGSSLQRRFVIAALAESDVNFGPLLEGSFRKGKEIPDTLYLIYDNRPIETQRSAGHLGIEQEIQTMVLSPGSNFVKIPIPSSSVHRGTVVFHAYLFAGGHVVASSEAVGMACAGGGGE